MNVTLHFMERVAQRVGQDYCAHALARSVIESVAKGDDFARFAGKGRNGNPLYRINIEGRGEFFVMLTPNRTTAITILLPGFSLARQGKRKTKRLKGRVA